MISLTLYDGIFLFFFFATVRPGFQEESIRQHRWQWARRIGAALLISASVGLLVGGIHMQRLRRERPGHSVPSLAREEVQRLVRHHVVVLLFLTGCFWSDLSFFCFFDR